MRPGPRNRYNARPQSLVGAYGALDAAVAAAYSGLALHGGGA